MPYYQYEAEKSEDDKAAGTLIQQETVNLGSVSNYVTG